MRVAPIHIGLSVVVGKDRWVNIIPMLPLPYQRLAEGVFERTVRSVGNEDCDAVTMEWSIEVVFAVALYGLDGPCAIVATAPGNILQGCYGTVLCPVYHICGGPQQPVVHEETGGVFLVQIGNIFRRSIM